MDIDPAHLAQPQEPSAAGRMSGGSYPPMSNPIAVVSTQYLSPKPIDLAVSEKTISLSDGDYAVTDVNGAVLFKVRAVVLSLRDHRLLLDAAGNPVVTLKQKIITAHKRWQAFRGDSTDPDDLLFSVKKSHMIQLLKTELEVFLASNTAEKACDFKVRGSFLERSCTVYKGESDLVIAQMSKQYTVKNAILGKDAFGVTVYPSVDYAFIIALVVILDEIENNKD